jgi:uncharacterized protein YbbK (DUF523 family)
LGKNCKYNGGNNLNQRVLDFIEGHEVIGVCPEQLGGLSTPRLPAEIVDGIVTNKEGISVDVQFRKGAQTALAVALEKKVDLAILQSRSPSCGVNEIYDGNFSGKKIKGQGVFAKLLSAHGIKVLDAEDVAEHK